MTILQTILFILWSFLLYILGTFNGAEKERKDTENYIKTAISITNKKWRKWLKENGGIKRDIPMGVSQWRNHGKKWGYWEFWLEEIRK